LVGTWLKWPCSNNKLTNGLTAVITPQFLRFLVAGGIAAVSNYGSRFIYNQWTSYEIAIILAYLTGMIVAFVLMRGHVFNANEKALAPQLVNFVLINVLAVLQTLLISVILAYWVLPAMGVIEHAEALAHLIGVLVPVVTSYIGHKYLTFK
jgi:putative flippase GtrA